MYQNNMELVSGIVHWEGYFKTQWVTKVLFLKYTLYDHKGQSVRDKVKGVKLNTPTVTHHVVLEKLRTGLPKKSDVLY